MPDEAQDRADLIALARAAEGDRAAFAGLVVRHQAAVLRLARALTPSEATAEEVLQEAFAAAFRNAAAFRGEASVRTWLLTIARHAAARALRRRVDEPADLIPLHELGEAAGWGAEATPEEEVASAERRAALHQALETLSEEDRAVIVLRDLEGLSGPEAAEVLGLTLPALKTRLHRGRLRLMAALQKRGGAHGP